MKNVIAAALAATLISAPAFAQSLPTNNTVAGGQGDAKVAGQGFVGGSLSALAIAIPVALAVIVAATSDDDPEPVSTTTE